MMNITEYKKYAPLVLRLGTGLVFIWFGLGQIFNPIYFQGFLPEFILNSNFSNQFLLFNGIFDFIFGSLLVVGLFTRIASIFLSLHLFGIIIHLGYGEAAVRDIGLLFSLITIILLGSGKYSLDYKLGREKDE